MRQMPNLGSCLYNHTFIHTNMYIHCPHTKLTHMVTYTYKVRKAGGGGTYL